jgi:hypothetical protein
MRNIIGGACNTHDSKEECDNTKGRGHCGDRGVDGRIILKLILNK